MDFINCKEEFVFLERLLVAAGSLAFLAGILPSLKRTLAFSRCLSEDDALDAYVLVQVGPMNALSLPNKTPPISFLWCTVQEPRQPCKRSG